MRASLTVDETPRSKCAPSPGRRRPARGLWSERRRRGGLPTTLVLRRDHRRAAAGLGRARADGQRQGRNPADQPRLGIGADSPGAPYDWSHYDPVIAGAARNGIRVLATVYSSPEWAEPTPEYPPLGPRLSQFEDFVRAAVGRYGSNGSFWRDHPDVPKLPVTDWQVWNEPNSPLFWKPKPDPARYLELLRGFDASRARLRPRGPHRARRPLPHAARRHRYGRLHGGPLPRRRPGPVRRRGDPPVCRESPGRARAHRGPARGDGPQRATRTAASGSARSAGHPQASPRA